MFQNSEFWEANEKAMRDQRSSSRWNERRGEAGIADDVEKASKRTYWGAYNSPAREEDKEIPELMIVAGIFLCRLALWFFFRRAQSQGMEVGDL